MKDYKTAEQLFKAVEKSPKFMATGLMMDITEQFSMKMEADAISQKELAKRIGKTQPYVSKILGRGTNMTLETIVLFADALGLDVIAPRFVSKSKKDKLEHSDKIIDYLMYAKHRAQKPAQEMAGFGIYCKGKKPKVFGDVNAIANAS